MIDPASLAAVSWGAPAGADAPALAAIVGAGLARATLSAIGQVIIVASVAALAVILVPQRLRPPKRGARIGRSIDRPRFLADPAGGPHPWEPEEGRVGIACSGGGLRSASFCLGALQVLRRRGVLGRARYVAAVSGGSYIAGAFAIAEGERRMAAERARAEVDPPERDPLDGSAGALDGSAGALAGVADDAGIELDLRDRDLDNEGDGGGDASPTPGAMASGVGATAPFDSDSPEERWLRTNSNYLAPDVLTGARGAARLLAGLGVNLLLVWLVLFVVARPVGWLISAPGLHPELRSREPFVTFERQPTPVDVTLEPLANPGPDGSQFLIHVAFQPAQARLTGDRWPDRSTSVNLVEERPGLGGIIDGRFSVIRQPDLAVLDPVQGASVNGDGSDSIYVRHDPRVRYVGPPLNPAADPPSAQQLQGDLEVIELPELAQRSALSGRPPITFEPWMRLVCVVAAAIALLAYVVRVMFRPLRPAAVRASELAVIVAVVVAAGSFTVLVALPYLAAHLDGWLRRWTEALPLFAAPTATNGWSIADSLPAVVGFLTLALSALRSVLARSSAARPLQLLRYVSALVVPLVGLALFVQIVVYGAANGPFGTLVGFGLGTQPLPDWSRWLLVVGALLALRHAADAHAWSLGPYYARRLNSAFALRRVEGRPDHAEEVPYHEKGLWFTDHGTLGPAADPDAAGPQLVVCAAANVRDREAAPPGRPAVSFTFSSSEVGGPQTGWIPTPHLQAAMAHRRRRDLTVLAALGISGAAVSPAMGKLSLGPLGRLLAVLNVRLGVWLPHPQWVGEFVRRERHEVDLARGGEWKDRPGWPYLFREIVGRYRFANRYLYVSDGGHWENLGLVELLRRGCTEIYCLAAVGDGPDRFDTIGDALALAREELGVEFTDLDLRPLRPRAAAGDADAAMGAAGAAEPATARRGLATRLAGRRSKGSGAPALSDRAAVVARFVYPGHLRSDGRAVKGRLLYVGAALTAEAGWDVTAYAEAHPRFPHHSTLDQFFDHRQFESYRQLGATQTAWGLDCAEWSPPKKPATRRRPSTRAAKASTPTPAAGAPTGDDPPD